MEQSIPYGDLIVFAAVAAFIILRYRAMLGESRGRDVRDIKHQPNDDATNTPVIQLPRSDDIKRSHSNEDQTTEKFAEPIRSALKAIRVQDAGFSAEEFLNGARAAFDMVIDAFNSRDRETLRMLLSEEVFKNFDDVLNNQAASGRYAHTTLVATRKAEITSAELRGSIAEITVDFETIQIHLVKDAAGSILEGDASQQERVEDRWVFVRNLKSTAPDWKISET
jgi:predicted lipid-binding transport protein (Tim44 family)